ncbi:Coatomer subunit alpha [Smittium mucronatum]|uniref:Coatomer subunit alpha n=1 Tax=Smittium mucronatum TaxID=133383 RepID=A0A1R0GU68_9FUNG|nr:Coatomer subunit alpha [Smittium mucronatum]
MQMLTKFESKSSRVKSVAFHPKRSWILSSLHNGSIQLWDYRMGSLIEKFDDHEGPVRGIAFHPTQEIFVSGGDDYKIRVWSYKTRKCMFVLEGHMDYIRTVSFHSEQPWIISASDDQTVRIWNWQSRQCIAVLTGHNHYVMSAQFHPVEDLVVSASLDQTVRVWDISGLKKKSSAGAPTQQQTPGTFNSQSQDFFNQTDVIIKFVLEGHTRGVNWVSFHPTKPLIISCGDDRQIKLWRMSETKAWEVESFRGHYNNVSAAVFLNQRELIVSCSEDKTIRVWNSNKQNLLHSFKRENDRFWCLALHPTLNLLAAGHDSGLIVFKLERERTAYSVHNNSLLYVNSNNIRIFDINSSADAALVTMQSKSTSYPSSHRNLSFNHAEKAVLLSGSNDGGSYELYALPREIVGQAPQPSFGVVGSGSCAVWVGRSRFAVFDQSSNQILLKDLQNTTTKTISPPVAVTYIFQGPGNYLILANSSFCVLFDTQTRALGKELPAPNVKYIYWSPDFSSVALLSKHSIIIANKNLQQVCTVHESIRIKSAVWASNDVLLYTTLSHLKFLLKQGDSGSIKTIDNPVYLTGVRGKTVHCLDRNATPQKFTIDPTEYNFKLALLNKNYNDVVSIIKSSSLVGQSIIAYLKQKGYPEVALHFVKDNAARFELAIECGNMEVALDSAKAIDQPIYWHKLAEEALKLGYINIVEMSYQRSKSFDKLLNLYLLTGNFEKSSKLSLTGGKNIDQSFRYMSSLMLGNVEQQIQLLLECGQSSLAYLSAVSHGMTGHAEAILSKSGVDPSTITGIPSVSNYLIPPIPVTPASSQLDWPHLTLSRGIFDTNFAKSVVNNSGSSAVGSSNTGLSMEFDDSEIADIEGGWDEYGQESTNLTERALDQVDDDVPLDDGDMGWGIDADLELSSEIAAKATAAAAADYVPPQPNDSPLDIHARSSNLSVYHISSGNFSSAMNLLNSQISVVNFSPLKEIFLEIYSSSRSLLTACPGAPDLRIPLIATTSSNDSFSRVKSLSSPAKLITLNSLISHLQISYKTTTAGKFTEAVSLFRNILLRLPFLVLSLKSESDEANQMISICREYILGLSIERARRELSSSQTGSGTPTPDSSDSSNTLVRQLELASYFTHCKLQPVHEQLSLRSAMSLAYKLKSFKTSGIFAQRLIDLAPPAKVAQQANQILTICNQQSRDNVQINYNHLNPFVICAKTLTPIYLGTDYLECKFCGACYSIGLDGQVCDVCTISKIPELGSKANSSSDFKSSVVFN